jgi:hypothetical protein
MFFNRKQNPDLQKPPAFEFKLNLSEEVIIRLAPYFLTLLLGGTSASLVFNYLQPDSDLINSGSRPVTIQMQNYKR